MYINAPMPVPATGHAPYNTPVCKTAPKMSNLPKTDKESFFEAFNEWYEKYRDVVNERVHDKRIKRITPPYMRPKLRSAYLSIKRVKPKCRCISA